MRISLNILIGCASAILAHGVQPTLKDAFKDDFLIGAAVSQTQFCESDPIEATLVKEQFNSISPENVLKWENIHPLPGQFNFSLADRYVNFGLSNKLAVIGHNLIWHNQTPGWVFQDEQHKPVTRELLLQRMREHIFTVVGRYKGKIKGWDVVNEALDGNGSLRNSPWRKIIGDDYISRAFEFAHEADPQAELYYNDYGLEDASKRAGAISLIKNLQAEGIKVSGIGLQGHYNLSRPSYARVDETISDFEKLGVKVMITELDVNVLPSPGPNALDADITERQQMRKEINPYPNGLPDSMQQQLAQRYYGLFKVFLKHRNSISRVTFWGVTDADSWLNNWPVQGRTQYPLLFDRTGKPKPAFFSVLKAAQAGPTPKSSESDAAASH